MSRIYACLTVFVVAMTLAAAPETTKPSSQFLRWNGDDNSGKLQASIVTYRDRAGRRVDLVSAVHVADPAFFSTLDKRFKTYDKVLYEMVKPAGMEPPDPGQRTGSGVSGLQRFIKDMLGLQFQLDAIDYHAKNFVHADLDAETFEQMQAQRGESIFLLMLQEMLNEMTDPNSAAANSRLANLSFPELLAILASPDRPRLLKLLIAPEFGDLDSKLPALEGPNGSVLVTERNKAAIKVLQRELQAGGKNLAIFYGAAHMRDMGKRVEALGFHQTSVQWLTAWNIPNAPATRPTTTSRPSR